METGDRRAEEQAVRCPYLDAAEGKSPLCLSRPGDSLAISTRYMQTHCLTAEHVWCALFLQTTSASKPVAAVAERPYRHTAASDRGRVDETPVIPTIRWSESAPGEQPADVEEEVPPQQPTRAAPTITSPVQQTTIRTDRVTIAGTAEAGSEIALFDWQRPVGRTVADERGQWSIRLAPVPPGGHAYAARALDAESGALSPVSNLCTVEVESPVSSPEQGARSATGRRGAFQRLRSQLAGRLGHREHGRVPPPEPAAARERAESVAAAGQTMPAEPEPGVQPAMQREGAINPGVSAEAWPEDRPGDGAGAVVPPAAAIHHIEASREPEPTWTVDREIPLETVAAEPVETAAEQRSAQRVSHGVLEGIKAEIITAEPVAAERPPAEVDATRVDEPEPSPLLPDRLGPIRTQRGSQPGGKRRR